MKGFPKYLNIKEDVINCKVLYPDQTKIYLQNLVDGRFIWVVSGELGVDDPGTINDANKILEEEENGQIVRKQMKLVEDQTAHIFRLGLSVAEAETLIAGQL